MVFWLFLIWEDWLRGPGRVPAEAARSQARGLPLGGTTEGLQSLGGK